MVQLAGGVLVWKLVMTLQIQVLDSAGGNFGQHFLGHCYVDGSGVVASLLSGKGVRS